MSAGHPGGSPPGRDRRPGLTPEAAQGTSTTPLTKIALSVAEPAVLEAYRDDSGVLWAWCTHEALWHRHGGRCTCQDDPCICVGNGDGHRGEHCRCPRSPYRAVGYVLHEVGRLTKDVQDERREVSWVHGCRQAGWGAGWSCRHSRADALARSRAPEWLPSPKAPLDVAHFVAKAFGAIDWTDHDPDREPLQPTGWEDSTDEADPYRIPVEWQDEADPASEVTSWAKPAGWAPEPQAQEPYAAETDGPLALRRWRGSWMRWHETHWSEIEGAELQAELYALLHTAHYVEQTAKGPRARAWTPTRHSVGELTAALESLTLLPGSVDAPTWTGNLYPGQAQPAGLVACANGLLDINTRQLSEHDPYWFNLVAVPFDYDPFAGPPERWLRFLGDLWPDDATSIDALQEWFGYVLSGRTDLQKLLLMVGPPRSGKGTIVRILQELVGREHCCGPTLASLGTNFGLQALIGKPLAVVADARLGRKDTHTVVERLLSISGEDTLTVDRKYRDPWNGRLPSRVMVLSNELPHFGDASGAIATRFVALNLTRSWLGNEDITLERELKAELPGILAWALDGLARLNRQGRFTEPSSSTESVLAMMDSASPTGAFVRDCCDVGAGNAVPLEQLYQAWRHWCLTNGREHPGSAQTFVVALKAVVPTIRLTRPRDPASRQQVRTYEGIGLRRRESPLSYLSAQEPLHGGAYSRGREQMET